MTKKEIIERLSHYPDSIELAFVWFDKEEIGEHLTDKEWSDKCDDLLHSDSVKQVAEELMF